MKITDMVFKITGPKITSDEIHRFEQALSITLPDDYKEFLLRYNGGRSKLCVSTEPFLRIKKWGSVCDLEELPTIVSLLAGHQRLRHILGDDFVAIGEDVGGGPLVMKVRGENSYALGMWNFEDDPPEKIDLCFSSFTDLINHLTHSDDFV